ncbi:MAG: ABC transporter ATP-binding protein [Planctomycetota bacterium]|jgi:ABC-2 type transport system ATP-binding protein
MIRVKNLTKRFGAVTAVDDITFHVEEGEIVGFLGPNGAGKTTTLRILTCFHPADSGSASVMGFDVFHQSMQVRRNIGYLPESAPLYPEMRAREYLDFRAKLHGMSRPDRQTAIARVTERCWLGEFIDRPIGQLSKGMRQRIGLADALVHDPKVLVLDEPTIGLDPTQIRETRLLIKELGQRHTILLSSHILHEVEQTCNRTIIIKAGRIVARGSPEELRQRISAESRLIAEIKGPEGEVKQGVAGLQGVAGVECTAAGDWSRLAIEPSDKADVREDLFKLAAQKGWSLREIRREVASLEDYFVKIVAEQQDAER